MAVFLPTKDILSGEWADNATWLQVIPKKISDVHFNTSKSLELDDPDEEVETYNFLFPNDYTENITHTWEPAENVMSGLQQKYASTMTFLNQGTNVYKVDTPLLYKDSSRRQVTFLFNLTVKNGDVESQVLTPVKNLMKWSSASIGGGNDVKVELPLVFQLQTISGSGTANNLFSMYVAALTSIQPTYGLPYINGLPSKCELTLTFTDIEPLNRDSSFDKDKNIEQT